MASAVSNLIIYQGAYFITDFTIENDNGTLFDLTGYTVACKIKKHYTSSTSTTVTGAILTPATAGVDTSSLHNPSLRSAELLLLDMEAVEDSPLVRSTH